MEKYLFNVLKILRKNIQSFQKQRASSERVHNAGIGDLQQCD